MTHRLVTFLGIPRKTREQDVEAVEGYPETTYSLLDDQGNPTERQLVTPWIAVALARFFEPDEVYVISTEEAWTEQPAGANRPNGEALRDTLRKTVSRVERVSIPTGLSSADFWKQFQALKDSLRGDSLSELTLDITHGLRSQPFFAAAVTTFVSFLDEQRPPLRVVYGAHDLIRTLDLKYAPVLDLTPFVELTEWTQALMLFLKTGRVASLTDLVRGTQNIVGRSTGDSIAINLINNRIAEFARDLQTIRTGALILGTDEKGKRKPSSAKRLLDAVEVARDDVQRHMPPLADVLDRIAEMATSLVFDGDALVGEKGRDVLAALARLYVEMGRYIEALTTVREGLVSLTGPAAIARPGLPDYDHELRLERERSMKRLFGHHYDNIVQFRNDLDHAGFQKNPNPPGTLIEAAQRAEKTLCTLRVPRSVFTNISNHPSGEWCEDQRRQALRLADDLLDLPFPDVPPEADPPVIERLADKVMSELPPETTHTLVQGEFTLTMALVKKLQAKGIRCLAATTERRVETTADGREVREFRFVRFREYPKLA